MEGIGGLGGNGSCACRCSGECDAGTGCVLKGIGEGRLEGKGVERLPDAEEARRLVSILERLLSESSEPGLRGRFRLAGIIGGET